MFPANDDNMRATIRLNCAMLIVMFNMADRPIMSIVSLLAENVKFSARLGLTDIHDRMVELLREYRPYTFYREPFSIKR